MQFRQPNYTPDESPREWRPPHAGSRPILPPQAPAVWGNSPTPDPSSWQSSLPPLPSGPSNTVEAEALAQVAPSVTLAAPPSTPGATNPAIPAIPPTQGGSKVGRRALLTTAGLTLCCGSAALMPLAIQKATQMASDDAQQALQNGEAAVLNGLRTLEVDGEEISLDAAIAAAELARAAVQYIVLPVARINAFVSGNALGGVIGAVDGARNVLGQIGQDPGWLDNLHDMLSAWRQNINALPISLDKYSNADITSAEKYLTALKAKVERSANATTAK